MTAGASHAIVIGAGIAGLCAASALADTYDQVTVLDRDALPGAAEPRPGTPQDRHVHAILGSGVAALDELFPGLLAALVAEGAPTGDVLADVRIYVGDTRLRPVRSDLPAVCIARPQLEHRMRQRLLERPNVAVISGVTVTGLTASPDGAGVTGVRTRGGDSPVDRQRPGDLVVDASGRGTRTPQWLVELGYPTPPEDKIRTDVGYTSCMIAMSADGTGGDLGITIIPTSSSPRAGGLADLGGGQGLVSLFSYRGVTAPTDIDGFVRAAAELPVSDIHEVLHRATPTSEPVRYRVPAVIRRHYQRMKTFPDGLVVLGDATAGFNPVYGQGMSVAALEAVALRDHLRRRGPQRFPQLRRRIARISGVAWTASVSNDLRMPWVVGRRTTVVRAGNAYMSLLLRVVGQSGPVARAFIRAAALVDPPTALVRPSILCRVLAGNSRPALAWGLGLVRRRRTPLEMPAAGPPRPAAGEPAPRT